MSRHELISVVTLFLMAGLIACIVYWGKEVTASRADIQDYYEDTYKTLVRFSATWDRFMQVDEIEKELVRRELDSIRMVMNQEFNREVWRGYTSKENIFTIKQRL